MANFSLNYDSPMEWGEGLNLISNLGVSYEDSKYVQVHNLAETGETTLVNLRLGVRSDNGWSVVAYGRNLTDSDTIPLATRWFDLRTGSTNITPGVPCNPATATVPCGPPATSPAGYPVTGAPGTAGGADTGSPRAFFGALRRGRTSASSSATTSSCNCDRPADRRGRASGPVSLRLSFRDGHGPPASG
jgi:hypothetical protein